MMQKIVNMNKIIIFDFDGTIADTFSTVCAIVNSLSEEFGFEKLGVEDISALRHLKAQELLKVFHISLFRIPSFILKVKTLLGEQVATLRTFVGIPDALLALKKHGYIMGILSSNSEETIRKFLLNNDLNCFDFVYSEKDLFGKARILKKLMKSRGFSEKNVLYVGDETRDVEAAHRANVKVISVGWGFNTISALENMKPNVLISEPSELIDAVSRLD